MFDARSLSAVIRRKKKELADNEPELIGTSPVPDMNAQDIYDADKHAYVEEMTDSPEKSDSDKTSMEEPFIPEERGMVSDPMDRGMGEGDMDAPEGRAQPMPSKAPAIMSNGEEGESDFDKDKFKRLGRLNAYLDSLDI